MSGISARMRPSLLHRSGAVFVVFSLLAALAGGILPARAEYQFVPAYPDRPVLGPQRAAGAVIWSHGVAGALMIDDSTSGTPVLMTLFADRGWDVFRLNRPRQSEEVRASTDALLDHVHQLAQQGYQRVVLAGQSAGAWISLIAAGRSPDVHAVIANAPAYYGTDHQTYQRNADFLYDYVAAIRRSRVMISVFAGDPYDPGGRGPRIATILSEHSVPYLVLDQPEGFSGHGAGNSPLFLRRFGDCVLAIAGDGPVPVLTDCVSRWGETPSSELALPADLGLAAVDPNSSAAPFLGRWYGAYGNGREVMLMIERVAGEEVTALYIVGPTPDHRGKLETSHRRGRVSEGVLLFAEAGKATLRYVLRPDGRIDARWTAADGASQLDAVLHRLP